MDKGRVIWVLFVSLSLGVAAPQEPPPASSLTSLADDEADFRG